MSGAIDDPDVLAGEYVLGVLTSDEMDAVRVRAAGDVRLQSEIIAWENWLAPIADAIPEVAPPADLWPRIERAAGAPAARSANDNAARPGLWSRPGLWRGTTVAALALAAAFAAIAYLPREAAPTRVAALAPLTGPAVAFLAETRPNGVLLITAIQPAAVPAGRDLQLWVLPRGATRPASLGTFPSAGRPITAAADQVPEGAQLLVSLEPAGGSPTGQPTGAVLYGGVVTAR